MSPILTVVGATGAQGSSVVNSALKEGIYKIRAITRNVNSEKAKALASQGAELVVADVNDEQSLIKAFEARTIPFIRNIYFHLTKMNRDQLQFMPSRISSSPSLPKALKLP